MSAVTTILATAAVTLGVMRLAKHLRLKKVDANAALQKAEREAAREVNADVIDVARNPETGTFEVPLSAEEGMGS